MSVERDVGVTELLERELEQSALELALDRACAGYGSAVVVEGQAGIGKTTLLSRAREHAAAAGMRVVSASGAEFERGRGAHENGCAAPPRWRARCSATSISRARGRPRRIPDEDTPPPLLTLLSSGSAEVLRLSPLSLHAVERLVREQVDADTGSAFVEACHDVTGGNPFLLRELLREAADEHLLGSADAAASSGDRPARSRACHVPAAPQAA